MSRSETVATSNFVRVAVGVGKVAAMSGAAREARRKKTITRFILRMVPPQRGTDNRAGAAATRLTLIFQMHYFD